MNKFSFKIKKNSFHFGINSVKYLLGKNYSLKYEIINTIRKELNKMENSEYAYENDNTRHFKINDEEINVRKSKLIEINTLINLNKELKLGAKSIYTELLETLFHDIEYNDLVNTINILKSDLANYMNEKIMEVNSKYNLSIKFNDLVIKNIIKDIELSTIIGDYQVNQLDFNYEELVINQLEVLIAIASKRSDLQYIVIVDIPTITETIVNKLEEIKLYNTSIIVATNNELLPKTRYDYNNILLLNNKIIDLADEVQLYEKITMNFTNITTLKETNEIISAYLNKYEHEKLDQLKEFL